MSLSSQKLLISIFLIQISIVVSTIVYLDFNPDSNLATRDSINIQSEYFEGLTSDFSPQQTDNTVIGNDLQSTGNTVSAGWKVVKLYASSVTFGIYDTDYSTNIEKIVAQVIMLLNSTFLMICALEVILLIKNKKT